MMRFFCAHVTLGPGPEVTQDVCDEAINFFKANVFFQTYEIKGNADRLLIYLTLYVSQCINRMLRAGSKDAVLKEMYQLSIENFKVCVCMCVCMCVDVCVCGNGSMRPMSTTHHGYWCCNGGNHVGPRRLGHGAPKPRPVLERGRANPAYPQHSRGT